jgi:menaquinone-dependent protoporphyrinogen oxidase
MMRALIAYGTRYGSTKEIAERIGHKLEKKGIEVKINEAGDISKEDVGSYDLIVIGSAIIAGTWIRSTEKFILLNEHTLAGKRTAVFVCCMDATDPSRITEAQVNYIDKVLSRCPALKPISTALFPGVVNFPAYGFIVRKLMKSEAAKRSITGVDAGGVWDMRDWNAIDAWAEGLLE